MRFSKMVRGAAAVALSGLLACIAVAPAAVRAEEPAGHVAGEQAGLLDGPLFPDFNIGPVSVFGTFFDTLQEAVDAIGVDPDLTGYRCTLIDNLNESVTVPAGKNLRISLFAHTLEGIGRRADHHGEGRCNGDDRCRGTNCRAYCSCLWCSRVGDRTRCDGDSGERRGEGGARCRVGGDSKRWQPPRAQ